MDDELHQYHKGHDNFDTTIQDLLLKLRATQREAELKSMQVREMKAIVHRIQNDVQAVWKQSEVPLEMKRQLVSIFHKYSEIEEEPERVDPAGKKEKKSQDVTDINKLTTPQNGIEALEEEVEESRQREHLERTAATLRHKLKKGEEARYAENLRIMHENVLLLTEINILRKDYQASKMRTQRLIQSLENSGFSKDEDLELVEEIVDQLKGGHLISKKGSSAAFALPPI
ncbi:Cilia- and flagella-associated protein 57 [Blyttiomyces sp. JEL0837]|nr:Cilia- and flagella-associated protein 57 [Blyttiomyces sp. JEL0837]